MLYYHSGGDSAAPKVSDKGSRVWLVESAALAGVLPFVEARQSPPPLRPLWLRLLLPSHYQATRLAWSAFGRRYVRSTHFASPVFGAFNPRRRAVTSDDLEAGGGAAARLKRRAP